MNVLDYFNSNVFGLTSLTQSINLLPYQPSRIGELGIFETQGVPTTTLTIEERDGILELLTTAARGSNAVRPSKNEKRRLRSFNVPHIPHNDVILADSIQNVRAFGSDSAMQTIVQVVNDKLTQMRRNHEVTLEYHRIGALQGTILDGDGSTTIYNLFTEYAKSRTTVAFALDDPSTDVRNKCIAVARAIEVALGAAMYSGIHCFCGATFFDALVGHPYVKDAYHRYLDSQNLRNDLRKGFEFGGITFEEYRGAIGSVSFVNASQANFFPKGVSGLYKTYNAPADMVETVNTIGLPVYAKQERMKFDKGIELHTQSNPLCLCTQPAVLILGTI